MSAMCDTWHGMFHSRPPMWRLPSLPRVVDPALPMNWAKIRHIGTPCTR